MNDWKFKAGRALMLAAGIAAIGAALGGFLTLGAIAPDRLWVELWRNLGFLVFAGLFILVAWRPTRAPLLWELLFMHKAGLAIAATLLPAMPEARSAGMVDLGLAIAIGAAWVLTRGWTSWQHPLTPRP